MSLEFRAGTIYFTLLLVRIPDSNTSHQLSFFLSLDTVLPINTNFWNHTHFYLVFILKIHLKVKSMCCKHTASSLEFEWFWIETNLQLSDRTWNHNQKVGVIRKNFLQLYDLSSRWAPVLLKCPLARKQAESPLWGSIIYEIIIILCSDRKWYHWKGSIFQSWFGV